jgi:hypothetical protein
LSPGGRTHLHTNNTQNNTNNNQNNTNNNIRTTQIQTNVEECGPYPVFARFTLEFALQLRKKHGKTSVMVRKTSVTVQYTHYQKHPHITKPSQTHKHTHTHKSQNNIKPSQYKLKRNAYRAGMSTYLLMFLIHRYNTLYTLFFTFMVPCIIIHKTE